MWLLGTRKNPLILIGFLIPIICLLGYAAYHLSESYRQVEKYKQIEHLANLAVDVSSLVYEIQQERGVSTGYIGSGKQVFVDDLPIQRQKTDEKNSQLNADLASFAQEDFIPRITATALHTERLLQQVRRQLDTESMTIAETTSQYTEIISKLIHILDVLLIASHDSRVSKQISSYLYYINAKEQAGEKRALGAGAFGAGKVSEEVYIRFISLIATQDNQLESFKLFGDPEDVQFHEIAIANPIIHDIRRMENIILDFPITGDLKQIDASEWSDVNAKMIDILHDVEQQIAATLIKIATNAQNNAQQIFILNLAVTVILLVVCVGLGTVALRNAWQAEESNKFQKIQNEELNLLLEKIPGALFVVGDDGQIKRTNSGAGELLGYEPEEFLNLNIDQIVAGVNSRTHAKHRKEYMSMPKDPTGEVPRIMFLGRTVHAKHKNGDSVPVRIALNRVVTADGVQVIAAAQDMSLVEQANHEMENALDAAKQANDAKIDFLAMISHELRTPLNAIIGFSDLLVSEFGNSPKSLEAIKLYPKHIFDSGTHLLGIVNDILDLTHTGKEGILIENNPVFMGEIMGNLKSTYASQAKASGNAITFELTDDFPKVILSDAKRINQILINLMANAIKFTENGEIVVKAKAEKLDKREVRIILEVKDTGLGIPAKKMKDIFNPFMQVDTSLTRTYGGVGLGLTICKKIAEFMGGGIEVKSNVGMGSAFKVTFVAENISDIIDHFPNNKKVNGVAAHQALTANVLVVDDVFSNILIVKSYLEPLGSKVSYALNGEDAIKLSETEHFDLILMDIHMPGLSGMQTAERIQQDKNMNNDTPIFAYTADVLHDEKANDNGVMKGYIYKPAMARDIISVLHEEMKD